MLRRNYVSLDGGSRLSLHRMSRHLTSDDPVRARGRTCSLPRVSLSAVHRCTPHPRTVPPDWPLQPTTNSPAVAIPVSKGPGILALGTDALMTLPPGKHTGDSRPYVLVRRLDSRPPICYPDIPVEVMGVLDTCLGLFHAIATTSTP